MDAIFQRFFFHTMRDVVIADTVASSRMTNIRLRLRTCGNFGECTQSANPNRISMTHRARKSDGFEIQRGAFTFVINIKIRATI